MIGKQGISYSVSQFILTTGIAQSTPQRIISLVPSLTELICDLGLEKLLVGRTKFCIHPKDLINDIPKIGGTKNPRIKDILDLKPDLIIGNKEENRKEDIEALAEHCHVLVSDIKTFQDAQEFIQSLGNWYQKEEKAAEIIYQNQQCIRKYKIQESKSALYLIWNDPYMSIGHDTYIHDILSQIGYRNILEDQLRYPTLEEDQIKALNPDVILLSSEPYPFKEKHISELQDLVPGAGIELVDGEFYSWYGSRLANIYGKK